MAAASVSRMTLGSACVLSGIDKCHSPIVHRLISSEEDHVETLQDIPLLYLTPEQKRNGVVECVERLVQHDLVGSREWSDEDESEVDRGLGEDQMWWKRVNIT